jgi:hypothetical protein
MILIIIGTVLVILLLFLLLAPLRIELDTRAPYCSFQWWGIGKGRLYYDQEWKAALQLFFYHKTWALEHLPAAKKKTTRPKQKVRRKTRSRTKPQQQRSLVVWLRKAKRLLQSFTIERWQLALDSGDATLNAKLYPLNWLPVTRGHVEVNFINENYLYFRIRNQVWKLLWAYFKREKSL